MLKSVAVGERTAKEVAKLSNAYFFNIALSPDSRSIAYAARGDGRDDIWLLSEDMVMPRRLTTNNDTGVYFSRLAFGCEFVIYC